MMVGQNLTHRAMVSATIGGHSIGKVVIANSHFTRLRGWYGYRPAGDGPTGINAVLLTSTRSVHTMAMPVALDLLWLDQDLRCIEVSGAVAAWRMCCCWDAYHVLEWAVTTDRSRLCRAADLRGQQLHLTNQTLIDLSKEA